MEAEYTFDAFDAVLWAFITQDDPLAEFLKDADEDEASEFEKSTAPVIQAGRESYQITATYDPTKGGKR